MKNLLLIIGILTIVILSTLFFIEKSKFPVTYKICDRLYKDCFAVAKFDDLDSCQDAVEKGNWLCDSLTDPENINCRPSHNSSAVGYCAE